MNFAIVVLLTGVFRSNIVLTLSFNFIISSMESSLNILSYLYLQLGRMAVPSAEHVYLTIIQLSKAFHSHFALYFKS